MHIAIVIPTFNRAQYLPRALDSALQQTYADYVVTVVDDASTDESWQIITEYARRYPQLLGLRLGVNVGTAQAMNIGLQAKRWDAVTFHDSDDTVVAHKLAVQAEALNQPVRVNSAVDRELYPFIAQETDVVWNGCVRNDDGQQQESGNPLFVVAQLLPNVFYASASESGFFPTNSGLYRRSVFQRLGGFMPYPVMSDTEFQNRLLLYGCTVRYLDTPLYHYHIHDQSQTFGEEFHAGTDRRKAIAREVYARIQELAEHRFDRQYQSFVQPIAANLRNQVIAVANESLLEWQDDLPMSIDPLSM